MNSGRSTGTVSRRSLIRIRAFYVLRLELDGVFKFWVVTKGVSLVDHAGQERTVT
jgi:hypothetical protein